MHQNSNQEPDLISISALHIHNILSIAFEHTAQHTAVIVFDQRCELAQILAKAYQRNLPGAHYIDFDLVTPDFVLSAFTPLVPGDLVVLIQSTNFRLEAFRLRVELFKLQLKVIEHPHLARMSAEQVPCYIDALAYDPDYYRGVGRALKQRIDQAQRAVVHSGAGTQLFFDGPFEVAKLNIGDYSGMNNIGGQFPIGEVFTESKDLEAVHGKLRIFVFGDTSFTVNKPALPITLVIEKGRVIATEDSTAEFDIVLQQIRDDEGEVWVRELGFGMNRALSAERTVNDIGTYERMCGIHMSLGAKHGQYAKPQIRRADARYHVDVFAVTESVCLDEFEVYRNGGWVV
ncbi:aminopeptidase [Oxalobacteraceae bacterium GrIS 2.11]